MANIRHNRDLGLSARSTKEIDHHEESFRKAQARERSALRHQSNAKLPKATINIALAPSQKGLTAYGAVGKCPGGRIELSACPGTTPHRTALTAVEASLAALQARHTVTVNIVSDYVVENMSLGHAQLWPRRGWRTKDGDPIQSRDLWEKILGHCTRHVVVFEYPPIETTGPMKRAEALAAKALRQASKTASVPPLPPTETPDM